jgi:hypothetical protein
MREGSISPHYILGQANSTQLHNSPQPPLSLRGGVRKIALRGYSLFIKSFTLSLFLSGKIVWREPGKDKDFFSVNAKTGCPNRRHRRRQTVADNYKKGYTTSASIFAEEIRKKMPVS